MSTSDESTSKPDTPKKAKSKAKDKNDVSRFQGAGTNFRAKLIGTEAVSEARGDKMCQDAMAKVKAGARTAGGHKQRITVNVSLDGLKIADDKSGKNLHHHAVHRISFIARDMTDSRAFGYIHSPGDGRHTFFGIKTEKAAEALVLSLRDLFQVVFEMKKREVEDAKRQRHDDDNSSNAPSNLAKEENFDVDSLSSRDSRQETPQHLSVKTKFAENPEKASENVGNLLKLEVQLQNLEEGLHQMSSLGQDQWGAIPPSPGGWSAGSDSWGTPSTPRSLSQGPGEHNLSTSSSSGAQTTHQLTTQTSVVSAGGGFPTLPHHPPHGLGFTINPPSSTPSGSTQTIPALPKPSSKSRSAVSLPRPSSVQSQQSAGSTPPIRHTTWATFDSPSPTGPPPLPKTAPPSSQPTDGVLDAKESASSTRLETPEPTPAPSIQTVHSFGSVEDPFKDDPFFSSTPSVTPSIATTNAAVTATVSSQRAIKEDKYSVFSDLAPSSIEPDDTAAVTSSTTIPEGASNPFGESSVFTHSPQNDSRHSPVQDHSALNAAFASTPIQAPVSGLTSKDAVMEANLTAIDRQEATPPASVSSASVSRESSFKGSDISHKTEGDKSSSPGIQPPVNKPTLLELSSQATSGEVAKNSKANSLPTAGLGAPPLDPFGDPVSPATEAKLNLSSGVVDDPFDTSAIFMPLSRGPFDMSQLKPVSLGGPSVVAEGPSLSDTEDSPERTLELPSQPPPPLPSTALFDLGQAPPPPPRPSIPSRNPSTTSSDSRPGVLRKQMTFDTSEIVTPPPIPRRPPPSSGSETTTNSSNSANSSFRSSSSSKLLRQATVQFPLEAPSMEAPPPPPRPGAQISSQATSSYQGGVSGTTLFSDSFATMPLPTSSSNKTADKTSNTATRSPLPTADPFAAVTLPHSKSSRSSRSSVSPIRRERPRPRAKTPANMSSGLALASDVVSMDSDRPSSAAELRDSQRGSFGKGHVDFFATAPSSQASNKHTNIFSANSVTSQRSTDKPSGSTQLVDPFHGVDPFAEEGSSDPFSDMPDPFESPDDPFSKNFTGELFSTKAVTLSTSEADTESSLTTLKDPDPFKDDPFKENPFSKDPFDTSSFGTLTAHSANGRVGGDSTLRTDTSLDASVSLPVFSASTDTSSVLMGEDSPLPQRSSSSSGQNTSGDNTETHGKKSDPFQFDVFSNDFFKNEVNNASSLNNSGHNASWAFNAAASDQTSNKTASAWGKHTFGASSITSSDTRASPGLQAPTILNTRDNDSSNSEISDAFSEDVFSQKAASDKQTASKFSNPFL